MEAKNKAEENPLKLFKFIPIQPGKFLMGSPENEENRWADENQVKVEITKPFEMQETQITQIQWDAIMDTNPSAYEGMQKPVQNVSWEDAQEFIEKLNKLNAEYVYRLPTEAEWEYCCRAGTQTPHSCEAEDLSHFSFFESNDGPLNVKSLQPNSWGLYDMHGNVWEWCQDWYAETLQGGMNPRGPSSGSSRVLRGGSWSSGARYLRSAYRSRAVPGSRRVGVGFRLIRTPVSPGPITLDPSGKTRASAVDAILKKLNDLRIEIEGLKKNEGEDHFMGSEC